MQTSHGDESGGGSYRLNRSMSMNYNNNNNNNNHNNNNSNSNSGSIFVENAASLTEFAHDYLAAERLRRAEIKQRQSLQSQVNQNQNTQYHPHPQQHPHQHPRGERRSGSLPGRVEPPPLPTNFPSNSGNSYIRSAPYMNEASPATVSLPHTRQRQDEKRQFQQQQQQQQHPHQLLLQPPPASPPNERRGSVGFSREPSAGYGASTVTGVAGYSNHATATTATATNTPANHTYSNNNPTIGNNNTAIHPDDYFLDAYASNISEAPAPPPESVQQAPRSGSGMQRQRQRAQRQRHLQQQRRRSAGTASSDGTSSSRVPASPLGRGGVSPPRYHQPRGGQITHPDQMKPSSGLSLVSCQSEATATSKTTATTKSDKKGSEEHLDKLDKLKPSSYSSARNSTRPSSQHSGLYSSSASSSIGTRVSSSRHQQQLETVPSSMHSRSSLSESGPKRTNSFASRNSNSSSLPGAFSVPGRAFGAPNRQSTAAYLEKNHSTEDITGLKTDSKYGEGSATSWSGKSKDPLASKSKLDPAKDKLQRDKEEQQQRESEPSPLEIEQDAEKKQRKIRTFRYIILVVLVMLAGGAVGVVLALSSSSSSDTSASQSGDGNDQGDDNENIFNAPDIEEEQEESVDPVEKALENPTVAMLYEEVKHLSRNSELYLIKSDDFVPQRFAFDFLKQDDISIGLVEQIEDHVDVQLNKARIVSRFALATLYYATSDLTWRNPFNFLNKTTDECEWTKTDTTANAFGEIGCDPVVTSLSFDSNNMKGYLPEELKGLSLSLESLKLTYNADPDDTEPVFSDIDVIWSLRTLTHLDLSGNRLDGRIPSQIEKLVNLEGLILNDNKLEGTVPWISFKGGHYKEISLNHNELTGELSDRVGGFIELTHLDLSYNQLHGSLPNIFSTLINLRKLDLSYNRMDGSLPTSMEGTEKLQDLNLIGNNFSGQLGTSFRELTSLTSLSLRSNAFTGTISTILFQKLSQLRIIDLSDNVDLYGTVPTVIGTLPYLQTLNISRTNFTRSGLDEFCNDDPNVEEDPLTIIIDCATTDDDNNDIGPNGILRRRQEEGRRVLNTDDEETNTTGTICSCCQCLL